MRNELESEESVSDDGSLNESFESFVNPDDTINSRRMMTELSISGKSTVKTYKPLVSVVPIDQLQNISKKRSDSIDLFE